MEFYCLKGTQPRISRSVLARLAASGPTTRARQAQIHNFHTTSARVQDAQCAQTDAAVEVGARDGALTLGRGGPALRRGRSEGHLPTPKTIRARGGAVQEAALLSSSSLCRDQSPDLSNLVIGPGDAGIRDSGEITAADGFSQLSDEEAHTPLSYQIPEDAMRKAMLTSGISLDAYWHHGLYQGPNGEKVKVHYCRSKETSERVAQYFLNQEVVGFDIEWKPNSKITDGIRDNVSLIQFATEERIALFHIAQYRGNDSIEDLVAPTIKLIMEDPHTTKVGVSVRGDCTRLRKFLGIDSRGLFELSHLYRQVEAALIGVSTVSKRLVSLARQVEEHLQLPLWKGEVRSSDWTKELKLQQIMYAASDSYAGLRLYDILERKRKALKPTPPRPSFAELNQPIILPGGSTVRVCEDSVEEEGLDPTADSGEQCNDSIADNTETREQDDPSASFGDPAKQLGKLPQVIAAEQWATQWRDGLPESRKPKIARSHLRAYALWHHVGLSVEDISNVLRDPPLQNSTVTNYILESIRVERLPYDEVRVKDVLKYMPDSIVKTRYRGIKVSAD